MTATILPDMQISNATCSCVINAPVEKVDVATCSSNYLRASIAAAALPTTFPVAQP
jgi:hypothetical protein